MTINPFSLSFIALVTVTALAAPLAAQTAVSPDQKLVGAVADLSANACYGIASGTIALPTGQGPDVLDGTIHAVKKMGLGYGVSDRVLKALGAPGQAMVSRATMGSKSSIMVMWWSPSAGRCRDAG